MQSDPTETLSEAKQEIKFLETINKLLESKSKMLEETKKELETRIRDSASSAAEKAQEQKLLDYINKKYSNAQTTVQKNINTNQKTEIIALFRIFKQMSVLLLHAITKKKREEIQIILDDLEREEKIILLGDKQEPICSECSSSLLIFLFVCTSCKNPNFENDRLIEHYSCGNVSREKSYENDICPKCKKTIEAMGVDYKIYENYHFCKECGNKFSNPDILITCRHCNTSHTVEKIKFSESPNYKII